MKSKVEVVQSIIRIVLQIQRGKAKVGTAFEAYDTDHLWELGEELRAFRTFTLGNEDAIQEIHSLCSSHLVQFQPMLLKRAESARRAFATQAEYLRFVKGVSYGKLREALPVFDPDFIREQGVKPEDLELLRSHLAGETYQEVLGRIRTIKEKYDPEGVAIDYDRLWEDTESAIQSLSGAIAENNRTAIDEFRSRFSPQFITRSRMLMAAMNDEESFQRLTKDLPARFGHDVSPEAAGLQGEIGRVIHTLSVLRSGSPARRDVFRERLGRMMLGELSTLMKACGSDEEMQRHVRGRQAIQRLKVPQA